MNLFRHDFRLYAGLIVILAFVVAFNLTNSSSLDASKVIPSVQGDEGRFNPLQEDENVEGDWEDEEGSHEREGDHDEGRGHDAEEEYEGEEDEEEEDELEEYLMEMEIHGREMELERGHLELSVGRLEIVGRLIEIARDPSTMAGYAIMNIGEMLDEEEAIDFLEEMLDSDEVSKTVKNMIRMKLAELYAEADEPEQAKKLLKRMILGN